MCAVFEVLREEDIGVEVRTNQYIKEYHKEYHTV